MIPKIIHYCWLSNDPIPENLEKCMESWKRVLKGYEFIKWDFNRFDKESSLWVSQAYDNKKYAFAADYIRLYALYNYGGIYMDMDVEVLRSFDDLLDSDHLICFEHKADVFEMATIGSCKGAQWVKEILDYYNNRNFVMRDEKLDMLPLPYVAQKSLNGKYIISAFPNKIKSDENNILTVYPYDYFSPKSYKTGILEITQNTYSIHHFEGSWLSDESRYQMEIKKRLAVLPDFLSYYLSRLISALKFRGFKGMIKLITNKVFVTSDKNVTM